MSISSLTNSDTAEPELPHEYRALSKAAIFGLVLSLAGYSGLLAPAFLIFAATGLVAGLIGVRQIRRYPDELTGRIPAQFAVVQSALLLLGGGAYHSYVYATEVPEGARRTAFWELMASERPMQPVIPPTALELDGQRIFIKGYVHPAVQDAGSVDQFLLVPDMGTCCFGGQPKLTHMIDVKLVNNLQIKYSYRKRTLVGTFHVNPNVVAPDGSQGPCYSMVVDVLN